MATKKKAPTTKRPRKKSLTVAQGRQPKRPLQALRAFTDAEWRHIESSVETFDPDNISETPIDHWTSYLDHDINIVGKYVKRVGWTAHAFAYPLVTKRGITTPDTDREIDLGRLGVLSSGQRTYKVSVSIDDIEITASDSATAISQARSLIASGDVKIDVVCEAMS